MLANCINLRETPAYGGEMRVLRFGEWGVVLEYNVGLEGAKLSCFSVVAECGMGTSDDLEVFCIHAC